jgi:apolipoprotein N-acyltransferase
MKVVLAAILSGIMFFLSQGLADVWALAWFAPAPLLWLAYGDTPRWRVLLASVAAFAAGQVYLVQCYWGRIPPLIIAPLVLILCVAFASAVVFSGEAFRRDSTWAALLAFPAFWTALEYGIGLRSPHGSFGALGYAEVAFPAGIQVASLFGVHAVTFLLCLSANAVALLLRRRWTAGSAGVAVCVVAIVFGFLRLAAPVGPRVSVAALSDADIHNAENRGRTLTSERAAAESYASHIGQLTGVRVVVIPEGALHMQASEQEAVLAPLAAAAKAHHALIVAGTFTPVPVQNRAFAFLPDGGVETYAKRHPLLPFETEVPGREPGLLGGGYATQICKDMDFAYTVRGTAAHGVRLMIVPADDFVRDGWIHARMAIMRGVENGFAVLRSAFDGLETISDAQGRILARAPTTQGMVAITADVPLGPGPPLYTRLGDVLPWLCAALSVLIGVRAFAKIHSGAAPSVPAAKASVGTGDRAAL